MCVCVCVCVFNYIIYVVWLRYIYLQIFILVNNERTLR